jgi:hypothetical protein
VDSNTDNSDNASRYIAEQTAIGRECLQAALDLLERNQWVVLPLCHDKHHFCGKRHSQTCRTPGRTPLVNFQPYRGRLPTREEVEGWWAQWPVAGVGLLLGAASRVIGIQAEGAGEQKLLELNAGQALPATPAIVIPDGRLRLFGLPPGRPSFSVAYPVEGGVLRLLGDDTIIPLPPSRFAGEQLAWEVGHEG